MTRRKKEVIVRRRPLEDKERRLILSLHALGYSDVKLARWLGRDARTIHRFRMRARYADERQKTEARLRAESGH